MTTVCYLRTSTNLQRHGLKAQADACSKIAKDAATFADEGVSGSAGLDRRPGLLAAIAALGKGDCLLVAKRDRLARDFLVMAMIESAVKRKGARIQSAAGEGTDGDDPASIMMRNASDVFAFLELTAMRERTKAALQAKRKRSERVGGIPYGYRLDQDGVHLVEDAKEQEVIRLARMFRGGGMTLAGIGEELASRGYVSRSGKWHPTTIDRICKNNQLKKQRHHHVNHF